MPQRLLQQECRISFLSLPFISRNLSRHYSIFLFFTKPFSIVIPFPRFFHPLTTRCSILTTTSMSFLPTNKMLSPSNNPFLTPQITLFLIYNELTMSLKLVFLLLSPILSLGCSIIVPIRTNSIPIRMSLLFSSFASITLKTMFSLIIPIVVVCGVYMISLV